MKTLSFISLLLLIVSSPIEGQSLQISGSRVTLPSGGVLGAAFYEDNKMFFVQQIVLSTEYGGSATHSHRQLSSWNLETRSMIRKKDIGEIRPDAAIYPCGRMEVSKTSHQAFICSAESYLEVINPDSLETVGTMAQTDGQTIIDFAVDDVNGKVYVLSAQREGSIHLTSYSLLKRERQRDLILPTADTSPGLAVARSDLIATSAKGQIALYLNDLRGIKSKPGIYMCRDDSSLACKKAIGVDWLTSLSEISFEGDQVLTATSKAADDKWDCIVSVDPNYRYSLKRPMTLAAAREYCSSTGVHYAVGVVKNEYVVGATGLYDRELFSEETKSRSNSLSVWRVRDSKVASVVNCVDDCGASRNTFRIVASDTDLLFITYNRTSNLLYLYSISEPLAQ